MIDKYERVPGVIEADAAEFEPSQKYDLIVSVSTLEHIGFDEDVKDPEKVERAVRHLVDRCLNPGGRLVFTIPLGYNKDLDNRLRDGRIVLDEVSCLRRSGSHGWEEAAFKDTAGFEYDRSVPTARAVLVASILKDASDGRREL